MNKIIKNIRVVISMPFLLISTLSGFVAGKIFGDGYMAFIYDVADWWHKFRKHKGEL